jgi:acyl-CoA synthetase (NDP forming)
MPSRSENLYRLLNPKHIAFIGGADAAFSAEQCARHFDGPVWGVNPKRKTLGGVPCYPTVADLPEAPDAVFLATPRSVATQTIQQLSDYGAGGVACYTAGYGELGEQGQAAERELIAAAGSMALVGPNCYGLVNYTNGATLWPFGAGEARCDKGIALVMQSGMIPANLTMNDRSVPITYVISAGNQAVLSIEDYIDVLVDDDRVTAIGLYIEGVKKIDKFADAAAKALKARKPIAVLKAGSSKLASQLAMSHTGSLAGADQAFQALFDQLGMIRVASPVDMMETLKFLSVSGAPKGNRVAAFTCSGGDAALVADYCDRVGLDLPQPSVDAAKDLTAMLPEIATVANPLDYTTPIWGNADVMPGIFKRLIEDDYDAAVVIQDFPPKHIHPDNTLYRNDAASFASAINAVGIPGAVCSDLPENIDKESREIMIAAGVTPLQGIDSGLDALRNACIYGAKLDQLLTQPKPIGFRPIVVPASNRETTVVDEWTGKSRLNAAGIDTPEGCLWSANASDEAVSNLRFPVVVKAVSSRLPHKSEAGAVKLNVQNCAQVKTAITEIRKSVAEVSADLPIDQFLVESMVTDVIAELMIGVNTDPQFGQILVIASGGVMVELIQDAVTLLLPTNEARIRRALESLQGFKLLQGFRGRPVADVDKIIATICAVTEFAEENCDSLVEMDINPLMVTPDRCIAVDVLIRELTNSS